MGQEGITNGNVCAIFGDIVNSRKVDDRAELQRRVIGVLDDVNSRFAGDIIAPFRIVSGDEVAGLLRSESRSYEVVSAFQDAIRPHRMRFAVGIGEVSTELSTDINLIDGPALHRARAAIGVLKNRKSSHGRVMFYSSDDPERDKVLNATTFLIGSIKSGWRDDHLRVASLLETGLTLQKIGEQMGVSQQAISKLLNRSGFQAVAEGEETISSLLAK